MAGSSNDPVVLSDDDDKPPQPVFPIVTVPASDLSRELRIRESVVVHGQPGLFSENSIPPNSFVHFINVSNATGRVHETKNEQLEHIRSIKKAADVSAILSGKKMSGGTGAQHEFVEIEAHAAQDVRIARYVKALARALPPGEASERMKRCVPTSGCQSDNTIPRSGTRHA